MHKPIFSGLMNMMCAFYIKWTCSIKGFKFGFSNTQISPDIYLFMVKNI